MRNFIVHTLVMTVAIAIAFYVVPGFTIDGDLWETITVLAIIMGVVNAVVRPILKFFTFPLIILTLGFGVLILNTLMFMLSANLAGQIGYNVIVSGFGAAFMAALVVSLVNMFVMGLIQKEED